MSKVLANILFPDVLETKESLEKKYPPRKEEMVCRFAPSPTGFLHIGGVYTALINYKMAKDNNGLFLLRIEDTDKKREVEGSKEIILSFFEKTKIEIDEGVSDKGEYGPYTQSQRKDIYQAVAKSLVLEGLAYPCFYTEEELEEIRACQTKNKETTGIYGKYAKYRDITASEAQDLIDKGMKYVIRFKVPNCPERIEFHDLIKGNISMENNFNDLVLLKADGIPTYHFAHACDDHYMRVTHVIRSDEWLSSVPTHLQLFNALGFEACKYAHVAPIMKQDGDSRRKLSKRKDPESSAEFYLQEGYPLKALFIYLYTIINSNFEEWFLENPEKDFTEFTFLFENMGVSGPLYDLEKLNSISTEIIYNYSLEENITNLGHWANTYNKEVATLLKEKPELVERLFMTQGSQSTEHRKDFAHYSQFLDVFGIFLDSQFNNDSDDYLTELYENIPKDELSVVARRLADYFNEVKMGSEATLKELSKELGYTDKKKYAKDPASYKGILTQFYHALRIMLTHKSSGISMDDVIDILGYDEVIRRIKKFDKE